MTNTLHASTNILVHGHRGARAMRPENTLPAFEYALEQGVDCLELDMAVTKDNIVVASHDPHMNPAFATGPTAPKAIREMTFGELQQWDVGGKQNAAFPKQKPIPGTRVPTLDQVLALSSRGTFDFNIETKILRDKPELTPSPEEFVKLVLIAVRKHKVGRRIILQSFDFRTLKAMKKLEPQIRLSALLEPGKHDFVAIGKETGAGIISPHQSLVTPQNVAEAHKAGLQVVPWTANTPKDWDKLIDAKVDAIISDDPAALLAHLKSKGLH